MFLQGTSHQPMPWTIPTIGEALDLLEGCGSEIAQILKDRPFYVRLGKLGSFQQHPNRCHVLYATPEDPVDGEEVLLGRISGGYP